MTGVLVTGATGETGTALLKTLRARGVAVRAGSRTPSPQDPDAVRFDWEDSGTHAAALRGVDRVWLVPPPSAVDPLPVVEPLLAQARHAGVRRLVLLGSAIVFPGAPGGLELAARVRQQSGWVVLRPSGFMQNFLPPHPLGAGIRLRGEIRTAAGDGGVGWIDVDDVAGTAAALLDDSDLDADEDYLLTGPRALSYSEAAAIITAESGWAVRVHHLDVDELAAGYRAAGLPPSFAASLAAVELGTKAGDDARISTSVLDLTGHAPRTFEEYVRRNVGSWSAADRSDDH